MLSYLLSNAGYWIFSIACILLFIPLEKYFPRIKTSARLIKRGRAIAGIASLAILVSYLASAYLQTNLITAFLQLKLFSMAKLDLPAPVIFALSFLFMDFLVYALHWLSHKITALWRVHAIHHSDEHVTALTGLLHHPLETLISFIFVLFFAVIFGVPVLVLIAYPFIAAMHNAFAHADIALPLWVDRSLRLLIVTPDVHRTHHSVRMKEGNSNFGQIFTIWDRIFGTYIAHPSVSEERLVMGLPPSERPKNFSLASLLVLPFMKRDAIKKS